MLETLIAFVVPLIGIILLCVFLYIKKKKMSKNIKKSNSKEKVENIKRSYMFLLIINTLVLLIPLIMFKINITYIFLFIFINVVINYKVLTDLLKDIE